MERMKAGYLGPTGTFSEEAASRYFDHQNIELTPCATILDVLDGIEARTIQKGVVPIENTIAGTIHPTVDRLAAHTDLFVQGEIILSISQHLLGVEGANVNDIREVWSIPPALAQCETFIRQLRSNVKHFNSTAGAALEVKQSGRKDVGAIASAFAAKRIGLQILAENIQDTVVNHTRFAAVTKGEEVLADPDKTMLLILPGPARQGALATILNTFSGLQLELKWLEARPTKTGLGIYQFFMDIDAGITDERVSKAVSILRILGHQVRVLGSYKAHIFAD